MFDIDGTLIESGGAGGGALLQALQAEFQLAEAQSVPLHGRTDLGIMTELLESHGLDASQENLDRLADHYYRLLPSELQQRPGRTLPGVETLLARLQNEPCRLALLTGNMPHSAKLKLRHYGLWEHFEFGVFGDLAPARPALAAPALQTIADQLQVNISPQQVVIIGDTPLDVELAQTMQCRCLAVCTGGFEARELNGACLVVEDLTETNSIIQWFFEKEDSLTR